MVYCLSVRGNRGLVVGVFSKHRELAHPIYQSARQELISKPDLLTNLEQFITDEVNGILRANAEKMKFDYDSASIMYPFWQNYPPEERGRAPIGDQFPWIEVGEHAVGIRFSREIANRFDVDDLGFPTGADQRFLLKSHLIEEVTQGFTDSLWLLADIKSVGPRDDQDHTVMSHNQISGSGEWNAVNDGVVNAPMLATGMRAAHDFYPAIPPLIVTQELKPAPVITMAIKPVYSMEPSYSSEFPWGGQPLVRLDTVTIPNGLLLTQNPNLLAKYPGLLFPGKDDKSKDPRKLRARVSFTILKGIDPWRHQTVAGWKN